MGARNLTGPSAALFAIGLSACAVVDQFSSRIYDGNLNSQQAMNQETLLNIVRASRSQPLNFMAITQITGGQTEALSNGLPTVVFGPGQSGTQKQSIFGPNSLQSGVSGGYQSNPLVSSTFQDGMLSPITTRTLALLVAAHPREPVYYAVLDSIRFKIGSVNVSYRNDPTDDLDERGNFSDTCPARVEKSFNREFFLNDRVCSYSKFVNFLRLLLAAGLTTQLVPCETNVPGCSVPKDKPATASTGRICFDQTRTAPSLRSEYPKPWCGAKPSARAVEPTLQIAVLGSVRPEFVMRSPTGVFKYLGKLLREERGGQIEFYTEEAVALPGRFLEVLVGGEPSCFVSVSYDGNFYCVPQGAYATAMVLEMLVQLRNLSISPTDLNSAFSVRLVN